MRRTPLKRSGFKRKSARSGVRSASVFAQKPAASSERPIRELQPATRRATYAGTTTEPINKNPHTVNPHLRNLARGQPCLLQSPVCCGDPSTTVACHGAGIENGKGLGYKVGDHLTVWGCWACNDFTDAYNGATAEEKRAVFEAGHVRQVQEWRAIAGNPAAKPWRREAARWALNQLENDK
ncbi:MAG: nuclease domain-containing protein, partial [Gammaproteobacteria bacterium]